MVPGTIRLHSQSTPIPPSTKVVDAYSLMDNYNKCLGNSCSMPADFPPTHVSYTAMQYE